MQLFLPCSNHLQNVWLTKAVLSYLSHLTISADIKIPHTIDFITGLKDQRKFSRGLRTNERKHPLDDENLFCDKSWTQKVPTLVWGSSIHWNGIAMVLTFLADRKQTQVWRLIHSHTTKKKQTSFLSKSWRIFPGRQIGSIYSLDRVCFLLHSYSLMSGWIVEFHVVGKNEMH